jgi:hypothetical protein
VLRLIRWLLWGILGMVAVACASAATIPTPTAAHPTSAPDPTTIPAAGAVPAELREVRVPDNRNQLYYPTDLSYLGTTGRPQFINAYANW